MLQYKDFRMTYIIHDNYGYQIKTKQNIKHFAGCIITMTESYLSASPFDFILTARFLICVQLLSCIVFTFTTYSKKGRLLISLLLTKNRLLRINRNFMVNNSGQVSGSTRTCSPFIIVNHSSSPPLLLLLHLTIVVRRWIVTFLPLLLF